MKKQIFTSAVVKSLVATYGQFKTAEGAFILAREKKGEVYKKVAQSIIDAGVQREDVFTAEAMAKVPGWPSAAKGMSLSVAKMKGVAKNSDVVAALNAFSFWFSTNTIGMGENGKKGDIAILTEPKAKKKKIARKNPKPDGTGGDTPVDKTADLSLENLLIELSDSIDRETDKKKLKTTLAALNTLQGALMAKLI